VGYVIGRKAGTLENAFAAPGKILKLYFYTQSNRESKERHPKVIYSRKGGGSWWGFLIPESVFDCTGVYFTVVSLYTTLSAGFLENLWTDFFMKVRVDKFCLDTTKAID